MYIKKQEIYITYINVKKSVLQTGCKIDHLRLRGK